MKQLAKKAIHIIGNVISHFPLRYIVLESKPDLSDNTKAVFDEMIARSINEKYKMIWLCSHPQCHNIKIKNVKIINQNDKFRVMYYLLRAKCLISCNRMLYSWGSYQKSFFLCHGAPIKAVNGYKATGNIDFVIGQSDVVNDVIARELCIDRSRFVVTGSPRNDQLLKFHNKTLVHNIFNNKFTKIVVWYPTFRQHTSSDIVDASFSLPIIHDEEAACKINEYASQQNVLIVLKPHFSQDVNKIKKMRLSNIMFIDDTFFDNHNMTSYEFVGGCDALITDYSSIYFDFLLCNKPIAAIWEDIDEYRNNRGFAVDVDYYMKGAYKVYCVADFLAFIKSITCECDMHAQSRQMINNEVNTYQDDKSSKRVVDLIERNL